MDIANVHPEIRQSVRRIPPLPFYNRAFVWLLKFLARILPKRKHLKGVTIEDRTIGNAGVRIYVPTGGLSGAGLLWIHGGGLLIGRADQDDRLCGDYARQLGLVVVSVEYRLAPEHPFPAAIDDCFEAWQWLLAHAADWGVDSYRLAIAGQSAGGGLAASLAQRILDAGGIQPAAQTLYCPMLDDRTAVDETLDGIRHRIWNNRSNRAGWSAYLGQRFGSADVPPYAVPARRENLAGLAPAWIGVGDIDLFYAEDSQYAEQLAQQGVETRFYAVPMAPHAFETFAPAATLSQDFFASNYEFLRQKLGIEPPAR